MTVLSSFLSLQATISCLIQCKSQIAYFSTFIYPSLQCQSPPKCLSKGRLNYSSPVLKPSNDSTSLPQVVFLVFSGLLCNFTSLTYAALTHFILATLLFLLFLTQLGCSYLCVFVLPVSLPAMFFPHLQVSV